MHIKNLTIETAHEAIKSGDLSAEQLTKQVLDRAQELNPKLFAYLNLNASTAQQRAKQVDEQIKSGTLSTELAGIPVAVKDNMTIKGSRTTAGSKILENYKPPFTGTVMQKLLDAGAVVAGKTNLDEFAMGSSTENSGFYPSRNPWDTERVPGGSSGGSAVAVASGMAVYGLGSDTGGSVRQPAAMCGAVGMKPTYGRVSRHGLIAMASSLDQIGPITKTVKDSAIVFNYINGFDPKDSTTRKKDPTDFTAGIDQGVKGLRIGVPKQFFGEGLNSEVNNSIREAIDLLSAQGAEIKEIDLPKIANALAVYYVIMPVEVSSNLGRYDGIRYGLSERKDAKSLFDVYTNSREAGFGDEAKRRIILGTYTSSAGYYDAYYKKALEVQQLIREDFKKVFAEVDILVGPTAPTTAFKIGELADDPLAMYLSDIFTVPMNISGLPAISVPAGLAQGLPVGLQLIAPWWQEAVMFRAAYAYEQASGNHKLSPEI